ncbi:CotH kinase family protein [uncultured Proteiniphilum sp.]|uniref:CotH kinase family protein n=1 Tax=uncultured Proteiniphilum sp. TaxID=497637 RepID=UPI002606120D|nr:CotH kinase family protein [uncultured Proteiniphilum sp.]
MIHLKSFKIYPAGMMFLYLVLFSLFISCSEDREDELSSVSQLDSFAFHPEFNKDLETIATGTISDPGIIVSIPYGVSLDGLVATFTYSGASVKIGNAEQVSGVTENDFSEPVVYSVIAEDGTKTDYTVTVTKNLPRLPKVYINTTGGAPILDRENYVNSTVIVEDIDKYYTSEVKFTSTAGIRGRGNSTWGMDKKPYRVKLDSKASLLGMSKDKDWALLANHTDKTLLRNITAFEISRIAEMSWTPASVSVDFYLNGTYQGVYGLTEHVKVSEERLDMELVKSSDNAGEALTGFHFDEPSKFRTDQKGLPIMFKDPDGPTDPQFEYVRNYFNTAEQVLYSDNFKHPENGYRKYIDVESFINYYIVQELAKNVDGNMRGSCYLAIRRNGKIEQPLIWDLDIAFGNADHITWEQGASSREWDGWFIKTCSPWFDRFFEDPYFVSELKKRWNELKPELDEIPGFIREHAFALQDAQARNFSPKANGGAGWSIIKPEWNTIIVRGSYTAEVDYLVDFVEKRLQWLDTNINGL